MQLGRLGVFFPVGQLGFEAAVASAQRIEQLGYGTLWHSDSPVFDLPATLAMLFQHTERLNLATAILVVYGRPAFLASAVERALWVMSGGRFVMGIGTSGREFIEGVRKLEFQPPVKLLREYLAELRAVPDFEALGMDADDPRIAVGSSGAAPRLIGAIGLGMLNLVRESCDGTLTYSMPPEHTRWARSVLGGDKLLAVEMKVLLERNPARAREIARQAMFPHTELSAFCNAWKRLGFSDRDFLDRGSDRLVDAVVAWGSVAHIERRIQEYRDAGADHVCLQPVFPDKARFGTVHWETLESLAPMEDRGNNRKEFAK